MLPTEIADLLLSPEGYSFNTSPEKKDLLPHHSVVLTTTKHMHKNLLVPNKAINARAVRECNKRKKKGQGKEPPCQLLHHDVGMSQRGQCASVTRMQSPAGDSDLTTSSVQKEDTPYELCISLAF